MSDVEEPPTKMSKYEEYLDPEEEEGLEEGQEEWLSEGVLTDDDYVQTAEQNQEAETKSELDEPVKTEANKVIQPLKDLNTIQTTTVIGKVELHNSIVNATITHGSISHHSIRHANNTHSNNTQNIEEQLNNLESTQNGDESTEDLDAFLIRKTDGQVLEAKVKDVKEETKLKQEEDDGNDTDDLLRMLGEGDQKKKKSFKMIKEENDDQVSSDDDDDFVYERSQVKTLKVAKNAIIKRTATKAVPENMSDGDDETDQSSDEGSTVQRMFEMKKAPPSVKKQEPKRIVKHVVQVKSGNNKTQTPEKKLFKLLNTRQQADPKSTPQTGPKKPSKPSIEVKTPAPFKPLDKSTSKEKSTKPEVKEATSKNDEFDEVIKEEEFLEESVSDLDEEEFGEDSENEGSKKQRIMRPEMMDEEVPSDAESRSEDGSLYDELPSSDSEDLDDWFTLDIRAERAGDYLPLLGAKARELLLAERTRVSSRVSTLRHSLSALTHSARRQADQLRAAAMALAEIDDTLRAA